MECTMFGDLDLPLNASRGLSAIAEFLISTSYGNVSISSRYWIYHAAMFYIHNVSQQRVQDVNDLR